MGNIVFENQLTALGPLGEAFDPTVLRDYRPKLEDGIFGMIALATTADGHWQNRHFEVIVGGGQVTMNYRRPSVVENGGDDCEDCDYSTFDDQPITTCKFVIPDLEVIRNGIKPCDWQKWVRQYTKKHPHRRLPGRSPIVNRGGSVEIVIDPRDPQPTLLFLEYVIGQLNRGTNQHVYETVLEGKRTRVDQFDGLLTLLEEGNRTVGDCDEWPTKAANIDFGALVTGIPGAVVHPDSRIPDNHPPLLFFEGTLIETSFPVAGKNYVDLLRAWKRNVVIEEWGHRVNGWENYIPQDAHDAITRSAAWNRALTNEGSGNEGLAQQYAPQMEAVALAASYINEKYIQLWPDSERVNLIGSRELRARNKAIFKPQAVWDEGNQDWVPHFTLVFREMRQEFAKVENALRLTLDEYEAAGADHRDPYDIHVMRPDAQMMLENLGDRIFLEVPDTSKGPLCIGFVREANATMLMECPETILVIDGVASSAQPHRPIEKFEFTKYDLIDEETETIAAGSGFNSALDTKIAPMAKVEADDVIAYHALYGTTHEGVVRSYNARTGDIIIDFVASGIDPTTGGGADGGYVRAVSDVKLEDRFIKSCDIDTGVLTAIFDYSHEGKAFPYEAGDQVRITSYLKSTTVIGVIATVTDGSALGTTIDITLQDVESPAGGDMPTDCDWDNPVGGDAISLEEGGFITFRK